ncbi:MAG: glucodextranase DOMON-like domain-containing protein, partial [Jatrophihabitantaceae bacterium]
PWAPSGVGTGHVWPVLAGERGEQELAEGHGSSAGAALASIDAMSSGVGLVPEQAWNAPDVPASPFGTDPTIASIGFQDGRPAGSAAPLTWGAAAQVRLVADLSAGRTLERPDATTDRYVRHVQRGTALTVTSPLDQTAVTGSSIAVAGTARPGAVIDIADVATDGNDATTHTTVTARRDGSFAASVTAAPGSNVLVITAAAGGATAQTVRTVVNDVVAGTLLFNVTDPSGDDNGPGNYAYPTAGDFHPGAYDLTDFQVYDTGATVTFRVQTRDLTPTFGSDLGAQLVDVYIHEPGASPTSTGASFPQRNYQIAPADAWSRLIEVQGFGQRFIDASGATVGTARIKANAISRYITFSVDKAALGGVPAAGWVFTVTLHGQDGFSPDQGRAFTPTPGGYSFGVCAAASSNPLCTADPSTVPKVMDTITPPGVSQSDELNYVAHHPVVLQGVGM